MNPHKIHNLVQDANRELVSTGCFPTDWWLSYETAINETRELFDDLTWPKQLFLQLHYASMHLGLRYKAWNISSNETNIETEATLHKTQFFTENLFWSSLVIMPHWKENVSNDFSLSDAEQRLVGLCFGKNNPICEIDENQSFGSWKDEYEICLREIQESYRSKEYWPKCVCVAVHFAAFYVDLFQLREVPFPACGYDKSEHSLQIEKIRQQLSAVINNECILNLIVFWLSTADISRDPSGLPEAGRLRPPSDKLVSVRLSSELFLQTCGQISPVK